MVDPINLRYIVMTSRQCSMCFVIGTGMFNSKSMSVTKFVNYNTNKYT